MKKIILASASPRRREILKKAGFKFRVDVSDYEEDLSLKLAPHDLARFLSSEKAREVAVKHKDAVVIAADTFILFKKNILGKPHTKTEAKRMLSMLSNKTHSVITGFTVIDTATGKKISRSVETKVTFKKLAPKEIDSYIASGEPLDKAGAYAIQGLGALLVKKVDGDYLNVIGLPLAALADCLKKFGIDMLHKDQT
jgi:septum formation protein